MQDCSDSSMDDCNEDQQATLEIALNVQIPLWTIVTLARGRAWSVNDCSDSSMDDCNDDEVLSDTDALTVFRFLYGRL